jgi:hypothetical protein
LTPFVRIGDISQFAAHLRRKPYRLSIDCHGKCSAPQAM